MGDELTLEFAKELVKQEKVGQGEATDMLAIGFSTNDYSAHAFGPNSLELEEGVLRLDATLAGLFAFVDQTVGLDRTLIVLSADHGFDEVPEHQKELGFDAGRHYPEKFVEQTNAALQERYKSEDNFVVAFWNPSLYLNHETLETLALDRAEAERGARRGDPQGSRRRDRDAPHRPDAARSPTTRSCARCSGRSTPSSRGTC